MNSSEPDYLDIVTLCLLILGALLLAPFLFSPWAGKLQYAITEILLFFLFSGLLLSRKYSFTKHARLFLPSKDVMLISIPLALSLAVMLDEFDKIIGLVLPLPESQYQYLKDSFGIGSYMDGVFIVLGLVILAPIVEEMVFRGFIQSTFANKMKVPLAILTTSAIFSLMHLQSWWFAQLFVLSIVLGYLTWKCGSILPGVFIHMFSNGIGVLTINSSDFPKFFNIYIQNGHVNSVVLLVSIVLFIVSISQFNKLNNPEILNE